MNVPSLLLLPMWVTSTSFFSSIVIADARPDPAVSTTLVPLSHSQEAPISQFSSEMNAQSPGTPEVRVAHHQDLNKKILAALIVASTLLAVVLIFLVFFWVYLSKNSKKKSKSKSSANSGNAGGLPLKPMVNKLNTSAVIGKKGSAAVFDYQLLEAATNHFQERSVSGEGGRGVIYKARFSEKLLAAVKKLDDADQDAQREFENEVNWLSKIQHQNVVTLLGYCIHGQTRYLVYEMMQNGSLETQLHGPTHGSALTWHLRMKIAVDAARGLEFLHERCNPPVVHRDLKSSNILLDSDFNAKISDFGLAVSAQSTNNVKISGTVGYLAPEYLLNGKLTDKSDVYAFGIVLLELLMGRKPVEKMESTQCQSLVSWAMPQLTDRSKLPNIVDPVIKDTMDLKHLYQVAAVAVLCIQPEPSYRPLITDVLHSLIPLVPAELGGSLRASEPVATVGLDPSH
ncbi:probable receptor-like protein kinase At1g80640 isoform X2 [Rhodamnia argentea]|uniref:Probable receptor-like protein kinase At1g80640 isoform X2 n=1 Tax=Rhodamnia argentea TaxID=178133 RepID=A0A8B8QJZ6_9MYRT|nr:probable receptor-like protein kinase At1g80640 isoform X2 [Rhodamnia argentea]